MEHHPPFTGDSFQKFFLGRSGQFLHLIQTIERYSTAEAPILIQGETGTGKELVARALHCSGKHRHGPFVPVNCASLPDTLLESELFGHCRGAFTGANGDRKGLVEFARDGTLFLDEVDSLSPKSQAALLRFLQDGTYRPVGANRECRFGGCVIAASNADLQKLAESGKFRMDLYFRLNVLQISIPPLRERREDILFLALHFLDRFKSRYGGNASTFSSDTEQWMLEHHWPGNVRELENFVHGAFLSSEGNIIRFVPEDNTAHQRAQEWEDMKSARQRVVETFERDYLHKLMTHCRGNITKAARLAGKERRCLGRLLKKYKIDRRSFIAAKQP